MLKKLVKRKLNAFAKGTSIIEDLKIEHQEKVKNARGDDLYANFIGLNAIDTTSFVYESNTFYEYLKYAFVGKYYDRKISTIKTLIACFFILLGVLTYIFLGHRTLTYIIDVVLLVVMIIVLVKLKTGESYSSFYNRTFLTFLCNTYINPVFDFSTLKTADDEDLRQIIRYSYDKKFVTGPIGFQGTKCDGLVTDLRLVSTSKVRDRDGNTREVDTTVFDGFYLKIDVPNHVDLLKGNVIRIRADENIFSAIAEDTIKGIYESEKEIAFNSEEMNKSFDAKISGYKGFNSIDDVLLEVKKIITPSFENHLLYLRARYNSFNMNISDNGLLMTINMKRNLLQKAKHKELFDFKTTYREANEEFRMLRGSINGIEDFAYYNVFPFMERLYLINYLTYLYLSYTDFANYYDINNEAINNFEEQMESIYTMKIGDFKEKYTNKIKDVEKGTKQFALELVKEEK